MTVAAVELGGTKVLVTIRTAPGETLSPIRLATAAAEPTLEAIVDALKRLQAGRPPFRAIGVASFGPIDVNPASPRYGKMLNTPKPNWAGADLLAPLAKAFRVPLALETDVNAAALGEGPHAAAGCDDYAYITVGTGVGVGLIVAGKPVHGVGHPEAGHLLVRRRVDDHFPGVCFAHGDCVEGLISGPALESRLGRPPSTLGQDDPLWDLAGDYLAQLCCSLVLTTAPQRIVIGGSIGRRPELLANARSRLFAYLAGYLDRYARLEDVNTLLVPAALEDSGLVGALRLAEDEANAQT
jgi:fructokinase